MAIVFAGRFTVAIVGLVIVALLTRYLGPEGYGQYRTILTVTGLGAIAGNLGIELVVLRHLSRHDDNERFLSAAMTLRVVSSTTAMATFALLAMALPYDATITTGIWVAAPFFIFFQSAMTLNGVFQKHLRQDRQMLAETIANLFILLMVATGIWAGYGVLFMIFAMVTGGFVQFTLVVLFARMHERFGPSFDLGRWRDLVREGLPIAGSQAALSIVLRGDILLLSLLAPAAAVGFYGVPSKIFEVIGSIGHIYAGMMLGRFTASLGDGSRDTVFRAGLDGALVAGGGIILTLGGFAEPILVLMAGQAFAPAAPALILVSIGIAAHIASRLLRNLMLALNHQFILLRIDLVMLVIAVITYLVLIPRYSFIGAAAATAMIEILLAAAIAGLAFWRERLTYPPSKLMLIGLALALGLVTADLLNGLFWPLAMTLAASVYMAMLVALRVIPLSFLAALLTRSR